MKVLGIESSCDETAAAIVSDQGQVFSSAVASQIAEHAPFGGVVPELASRAHLRAVTRVVDEALNEAKLDLDELDAIAVTSGPGLMGALLVGVQFAKALAWERKKPFVGVDHLHGHLLAGFLWREAHAKPSITFPYIALLVSGGHSALYHVKSVSQIELLGQTRDDAAGEAFDKVAKLLGLAYPGGPPIDRLAALGQSTAIAFPRPMRSSRSYEFSFSGLKTAVVTHIKKNGQPQDDAALADVCASFQAAVVDSLLTKALLACKRTQVKRLVITGGVAVNRGLRSEAQVRCANHKIELVVPAADYCTDNAAMIAYAGAQRLAAGVRDDLSLEVHLSSDVSAGF